MPAGGTATLPSARSGTSAGHRPSAPGSDATLFRSRRPHRHCPARHTADQDQEHDGEDGEDILEGEDGTGMRVSGAAAGVLRFSEERDPAVPAQFVRLRVIDPEGAYWRRGIEAAGRWLRETGNTVLRVPYRGHHTGGLGRGRRVYPLGQWIADQRRSYAAETLEAGRVAELEKLRMMWSEQDAAWADGIAVAKQYAAAHGHFLPPTTATWEGHPIGVWAKNARAAARRARENEELRAAGRPVPSAAGAMTEARRDELDAIDPGWCPAWDTGWQRCYRLVHNHVQAGGTLPETVGDVVVQGEDLGRWVTAQRFGWEQLLPVQQWILENTLKLAPAEEDERPVKQTQDAKWAANLTAARQFYAREGHLRVPRKHVEHLETENALSGRQGGTEGPVVVKLGTWLDNVRKRAAKLPEQRRTDLDQLGMRW
ncbi:helicase associated domain-containing protein [Streptomyces sp. NPDC059849]|uniref:helicase associated domain-containing protein n=1 Tax=Streptomyces sp. NPDC059849 TaxID=3346969 RepID=UPI0036472C4C